MSKYKYIVLLVFFSSMQAFAGICVSDTENTKEVICDKLIKVNQENAEILSNTIFSVAGEVTVESYEYDGKTQSYFKGSRMRCITFNLKDKTRIHNVPLNITDSDLCDSLK